MINGCIFGDSLAKGAVYDRGLGRYTFIPDGFVAQVASAAGMTIENFSKFGCTVGKGRQVLERRIGSLGGKDFIALEFGGNDSMFDWPSVSASPDDTHEPNTPLAQFTDDYSAMVARIKEVGTRPVVLNLPPIDEQRYFRWISRGLNADNILKWLGGSAESIYRFHESYNSAVCKLAREQGAQLIDIRSGFLARRDFSDCLCEDGIHLNGRGHTEVAEMIKAQLPLPV